VDDTVVHGWVDVVRAFQFSLEGKYEEALAASERAGDIAGRFGDRDLGALAPSSEGQSRIHMGEVERGLAQVDEATIAAVGGEIEPAIAGGVCCSTIEACTALGDFKRAAQWTEAQDRWCKREHINGFPGMCRVFRAEMKRLSGDWLTAESEARRATDELAGFMPAAVGMALYEIGMIRLRRGDLPAAREALTRAHGLGRSPEPALSLVVLAEGNVDAALTSIRRALDDPDPAPSWGAPPSSNLGRIAMLPAEVEIALAAGDSAVARGAAEELADLADRYPSVAASAASAQATGDVLLAEGDAPTAVRSLRRAVEHWTEVDAPYEAARARLSLASAFTASGDTGPARMELNAAQEVFERLGAVADVRRGAEMLASIGGDRASSDGSGQSSGPVRTARTFVFTDIVDSTRLNETLGDDAIETAIAIQRRFDEQRRSQSFAPALRIGVHRAEANRNGLDYTGSGVNL